jgi:hypothetical protein
MRRTHLRRPSELHPRRQRIRRASPRHLPFDGAAPIVEFGETLTIRGQIRCLIEQDPLHRCRHLGQGASTPSTSVAAGTLPIVDYRMPVIPNPPSSPP